MNILMWPSRAQVSCGRMLDGGIAVPPAVSGESSAHLGQQLLFSAFFFFTFPGPVGVQRYHIHSVVLICISPVTDVSEYLFICLVAI